MNLFKQLASTPAIRPQRMLIYGLPGIGTSTFAAGLSSAVFVPADDSTSHIRCARFPVARHFGDLMQAMEELYIEPHDYRTVVVDPLDAVERLICEEVSRHHGAKPLAEIPHAGNYVLAHWRRLLRRLDLLRDDIPCMSYWWRGREPGAPPRIWKASICLRGRSIGRSCATASRRCCKSGRMTSCLPPTPK